MNDTPKNIKRSLDTLRKDVAKEIKRQSKELDKDEASAATFLANLASVEHQLKSMFDYWTTDCLKSYRRSGAKSHLFQEADKTLKVTLRDSNEAITGKDQNEIFVNAIIGLGIKDCYDACTNGLIYAVKARNEFFVDTKPQTNKHELRVERGVTYYIYTNLSAVDKVKRLQTLGKQLGCDIHASYE